MAKKTTTKLDANKEAVHIMGVDVSAVSAPNPEGAPEDTTPALPELMETTTISPEFNEVLTGAIAAAPFVTGEVREINTFRSGSKKERELYEEIKLTAKRLEALVGQVEKSNGTKERAVDAINVLIKQLTA